MEQRKKYKIEKIKGINKKSSYDNEELILNDPYDIFFTSPFSKKENLTDTKFDHMNKNIQIFNKPDIDQVDILKKENKLENLLKNNFFKENYNIIKKIFKFYKIKTKKNESFVHNKYLKNYRNFNLHNKQLDSNSTYTIESDLISSLIVNNEEKKEELRFVPQIINRLRFYSTIDFQRSPIGMYKFPFEQNIKYEETSMFKKTHELFLNSLNNLYKISKKDFVLKFKEDILFFNSNHKVLLTTCGLQKLFDSNEIEYKIKNNFLHLSNVNISLAMDLIINEPLTSSYILPFLMCKEKFINGMYYEITLNKNKKIVRSEDKLIYSFDINGPFYSYEFKEFFKFKHKIFI